jgi:hypothetical protein
MNFLVKNYFFLKKLEYNNLILNFLKSYEKNYNKIFKKKKKSDDVIPDFNIYRNFKREKRKILKKEYNLLKEEEENIKSRIEKEKKKIEKKFFKIEKIEEKKILQKKIEDEKIENENKIKKISEIERLKEKIFKKNNNLPEKIFFLDKLTDLLISKVHFIFGENFFFEGKIEESIPYFLLSHELGNIDSTFKLGKKKKKKI